MVKGTLPFKLSIPSAQYCSQVGWARFCAYAVNESEYFANAVGTYELTGFTINVCLDGCSTKSIISIGTAPNSGDIGDKPRFVTVFMTAPEFSLAAYPFGNLIFAPVPNICARK